MKCINNCVELSSTMFGKRKILKILFTIAALFTIFTLAKTESEITDSSIADETSNLKLTVDQRSLLNDIISALSLLSRRKRLLQKGQNLVFIQI
ncbi:hypothetical protein BpHYR1_014083 [Brachionus plicatilis]|uniref:Uncharacterized protein n=1 Tax=Brachionus plicatilis TaxID=10195 RepID=A0A3M7SG04_BRAPC|nr:hypothetical protein BpHYR1_014083 [Brachionus plicatilis]